MKIKIGKKLYGLNTYYRSSIDKKPTVVFDIEATYDEIYALAKKKDQSFIVVAETQSGKTEEIDVSHECKEFYSLLNIEDARCELTMAGYSDVELLQQVINDLLGV